MHTRKHVLSSGAVWESRWPSWAVRPNEPSGFRGRKAICFGTGLSLSLICQLTSEDIKQHYLPTYRKHVALPTRLKRKKGGKEFCLDSNDFGFICAAVSNTGRYKRNA